LTKSEYRHQQERTDGGPFLILEPFSVDLDPDLVLDEQVDANKGVFVYFTDVHPDQAEPSDIELVLTIRTQFLDIYPINVRPDKPDYLLPKYKNLRCITVNRKIAYPYSLPSTVGEVEDLLEELPVGFDRNFRFGLGLDYKYRHIAEAVDQLPGIEILWINGGSKRPVYDPPYYRLTEGQYHALRKEMNSITARGQRKALKEKVLLAHNALLTPVAPAEFPRKVRGLESGEIAEIRGDHRTPVALSKQDQRAVISLMAENVKNMVVNEPRGLMQLKDDIELVTLTELIGRFAEMLGKDLAESKWQFFFTQNPFVLSLALSVPFMLVQSTAYAGGKRMDGRGGKHPDFIYAAASTGNLAIVEIKKPGCPLLHSVSYRDDVYALSHEVSGAVTQVLTQRLALQKNIATIKDDSPDLSDIHSFSTKCVVLAGRNPDSHAHKKSFELARNAIPDVTIMTFDELLTRLKTLHEAMAKPLPPPFPGPSAPDDDVPF